MKQKQELLEKTKQYQHELQKLRREFDKEKQYNVSHVTQLITMYNKLKKRADAADAKVVVLEHELAVLRKEFVPKQNRDAMGRYV